MPGVLPLAPPSMISSPRQHYRQALGQPGWQSDPAQARAVEHLEACWQALQSGARGVRGVYLWGPVGRGKTWLMDRFQESMGDEAQRLHFHRFMQGIHRRLHHYSGQTAPLERVAEELARQYRVLCLDELFIDDIGDAMIVGGLLEQLLARGMTLLATSNEPPWALYRDGFNRQRLLPAIEALEQHMAVVALDGAQDYRLLPAPTTRRYWVGDREGLARSFDRQAAGEPTTDEPWPMAGGRRLRVVQRSPRLLWCRFEDLCEAAWSSLDYIALCDEFQALFLSDVPSLSSPPREGRIARGTEDAARLVAAGERQLPSLGRHDDSVRRLIALVDECHDRQRPLHVHAATDLADLYTEGQLLFPFRRTLSRLQVMQRRDWPPGGSGD